MKKLTKPLLIVFVILIFLFSGCGSNPGQTGEPENFYENSVTNLNVGQASCALIESEGEFCLVDAGFAGGGTDVVSYLNNRGVEEIELLILTHFHTDHTSEVTDILRNFEVKNLLIPNLTQENTPTNRFYERLIEDAEDGRYDLWLAEKDLTFDFGGGKIKVLADTNNWRSANDTSICFSYKKGNFTALFTGDAEEKTVEIIQDLAPKNVDYYCAGHHGSSDANPDRFLDRINPGFVAISCGADNPYGHPHREVIDYLEKHDIPYLVTCEAGNIVLNMDTKTVKAEDEDDIFGD